MALGKMGTIYVKYGATSFLSNIKEAKEALHEAIEIKCFYEGSSTLLIGNETIVVNKGDVVVVNPYEFHTTINCGENEKGRYHLFMVPIDVFLKDEDCNIDLRDLVFNQKKRFKNHFQNDEKLYRLLSLAAKENEEEKFSYKAMLKAYLTEFFVTLMRDGLQSETNASENEINRAYRLIEPAIRHIRDNYFENISIEFLSKLCNLNKHYFCRIFKSATGKTAIGYLRDYRMIIANVLITNSQDSIYKVALSCGFDDENYFCRCYKRYYGVSPTKSRSLKSTEEQII